MTAKTFLILGLIILASGSGYLLLNRPSPGNQTPTATPAPVIPVVTVMPTPEPTPLPTPSPTITRKTLTTTKTKTYPTGPTAGQISCNYQSPAGPDHYGTAGIVSNWTNVIVNSAGVAKVSVCVSTNGGAFTQIGSDSRVNGSRTDSVAWLILSTGYTFNLYDTHGGTLPNCSGDIIAGCQLNTAQIPTVPGGSHPSAHH